MANNRGPSKGCQRCRKLKMKCDQEKPTCERCHKSGQACQYLSSFDRMHRDQNVLVQSVATKRWRQRATKTLQNTPSMDLDTSLHTQAFLRFCYDFAGPVQGPMARLPKLMQEVSPDSCVSSALNAVVYANFANRCKSREASEASSVCYGRTLQKLATLMATPEEMQRKGALLVIFLLALYETLASTVRDGSWITHMQGTQSILAHRDSINCKDADTFLSILCMHLVVYYLRETKTPPPPFDALIQTIPFQFEHKRRLAGLMLKTARANVKLRDSIPINGSISTELLHSALDLDFQLERWTSDLPPEWATMNRYPMNNSNRPAWARELFSLPGAPEHMACYSSLLAAADWNMYRATRIRLNLSLLEALSRIQSSAWENQTLKSRTQHLLSMLTIEIAEVIPYALSLSRDGTSDHASPDDIPGIKAYVQLWPLITAYVVSRHVLLDREKLGYVEFWLKRVLCFCGDGIGLAKVHAFFDEEVSF